MDLIMNGKNLRITMNLRAILLMSGSVASGELLIILIAETDSFGTGNIQVGVLMILRNAVMVQTTLTHIIGMVIIAIVMEVGGLWEIVHLAKISIFYRNTEVKIPHSQTKHPFESKAIIFF